MGAPPPAWIAPDLLNGFANFGAGHAEAAFHKDALGMVTVKGLISTAAGAAAFVTMLALPAGYRPLAKRRLAVEGNGATFQSVQVNPNGDIGNVLAIAAAGYISIEFSFLAEQ